VNTFDPRVMCILAFVFVVAISATAAAADPVDTPEEGVRAANEKPKLTAANCGARALEMIKRHDQELCFGLTCNKHTLVVVMVCSETIQKCCEKAPKTVRIRWEIKNDGSTAAVKVETPDVDAKAKKCFENTVGAWRFPKYAGDRVAPMAFPFKCHSRGTAAAPSVQGPQ
jgi:hypothetical protein